MVLHTNFLFIIIFIFSVLGTSIIATPGRLLHHISEVGNIIKSVEYIVFDEADQLFEMGFEEQLMQIISYLPNPSSSSSSSSSVAGGGGMSGIGRQTLLFSATLPQKVVEFSHVGLNNPVVVRLDSESKLPPNLAIQFFTVRQQEKDAALIYLLTHSNLIQQNHQTIVFTATR